MSQVEKSNLVKPNNSNVTHYGAAPEGVAYCKDHSKVTSYALCLNKASDYPEDDRRSFCSICPCGKDTLKGIPSKPAHGCGVKSSNCPNIMFTADGAVVKTH